MRHVDKLKTSAATQAYRDNHERIFGKPTGTGGLDDSRLEALRRERHKREVADGRKDAQYYLDNEVRVSQDPNFIPKLKNTVEYRHGWTRIFGKA